jgi:hypothetical protein
MSLDIIYKEYMYTLTIVITDIKAIRPKKH